MKKIILIMAIILAGVLSCSKSSKEESEVKQNNIETSESKNTSEAGSSYETEMLKRMEAVQKEVQPALDSGVTSDMSNAAQKLEEAWGTEMKKAYDLLLSELPADEKIKLQKEQEWWVKKGEEGIAEDDKEDEKGTIEIVTKAGESLGSVEDRALELARRYDELRTKK